MKTFHICTISNDPAQYAAMREAFLKAGFDEERCVYTLLDNSKGNHHEPYSAFNRVKATSRERYIIFCHQDVFPDRGQGYVELVNTLEELSRHDPNWAVAGNSGVNPHYQFATRITDRLQSIYWTGALPESVCTLDENFLVVNNAQEVCWSSELSGFHFYGPDICLNAIRRGYKAYVIDFHLTHLGLGVLSQEFWAIKAQFQQHWEKQFHFAFVVVPTGVPLVLTRYRWLQALSNTTYVQRRILRPRAFRIARRFQLSPKPGRGPLPIWPGCFARVRENGRS